MLKKKNFTRKGNRKNAPIVELLSPRVLYSADPFGLSGDLVLPEDHGNDAELSLAGVTDPGLFERAAVDDDLLAAEQTADALQSRTEVIFVDTSVDNHQQIVDSLLDSNVENISYVVYTLSRSETIDDISQVLSQHSQLDAIHFISHGTDASFSLGSSIINNDSFADQADTFSQWGNALAVDGDLLFYGCNLAETSEGQQLVASIASATNADVGASENRTGHASLNADWQLEFSIGQIETDTSHLGDILSNWESQLAAIIVDVDTFNDTDAADSGDTSSIAALQLDSGADGKISLREAIEAANADPEPEITIQLSAGTYEINLGDLNINKAITIVGSGPGTILDSNGSDRIFQIENAGEVHISQLTIQDGNASSDTALGGGIYSSNTNLILEGVTLTDNQAAQGGGLYINSGVVTIIDTVASNNRAVTHGGGAFFNTGLADARNVEFSGNEASLEGGGFFLNTGQLDGLNLTVTGNTTTDPINGKGGGAFVSLGLATLRQSTFSDNESAEGGGLFAVGRVSAADNIFTLNRAETGGAVLSTGTTEITRSLIHDNEAGSTGGIVNKGTTVITDSTLSENTSSTNGSAVHSESGTTTIDRSTIFNNTVTGAGDDAISVNNLRSTLTLQNSLIAGHTGAPIDNNVISGGFNLSDSVITNINNSQSTDQEVTDTGLDTVLQNNGGFVPSYALLPGSPAINAGSVVPINNTISITDTTGAARSGNIDIGAFEFRAADVNNGPSVVTNNGVALPVSATTQIQANALVAIDPDSPEENIIFEITSLPVGGNLKIDTTTASVGSTFTQDQLINGKISYQHTGAIAGNDSFSFFVTDGTFESQTYDFDITITGQNFAPALDDSTVFLLQNQSEFDTNPPGTSVSNILASVSGDPITDQNLGALEGITVIAADETNGIWEFKADPSDANWTPVTSPVSGVVFDGNALPLELTSLLRFVPNSGFTGEAHIDFRAHDWTSGWTAGVHHVLLNADPDPITNAPGFNQNIGGGGANSPEVGRAEVSIIDDNPIRPLPAVPIEIDVLEDNTHNFTGPDRVSIDDSSGKNYPVQVILQVSNGVLNLSNNPNVDIQNNNSPVIVIEGLRSDINTALESLVYVPDQDFNGTDTLLIDSSLSADRQAHFSFDNGNANDDNPGTSNDGTLINGATTTNSALELDGVDSYVFIPSDFGVSDTVTVATWVEFPARSAIENETNTIISINGTIGIDYRVSTNTLSGYYFVNSIFPVTLSTFFNVDLTDGNRHHIAYTIDNATNRQALYIDGLLVAQSAHTQDILPDLAPAPFTHIGTLGNAATGDVGTVFGSRFTDATLDDIQIYTRALSADEIEAIHNGDQDAARISRAVDITVLPVNDRPELDHNISDPNTLLFSNLFIEGNGAVAITGNTSISDIDNTTISELVVSITNIKDAGDEIIQASIPGGWTQTYANGVLTIVANTSTTAAVPATHNNWINVIESLTYENTSLDPDTTQRQITLQISDGTDTNNPLATSTISVQAVNNPPGLSTIEALPARFTENAAPLRVTGNLTLTEVDDSNIESATVSITGNFIATEDSLVFADQPGITGVYDAATGVLTLTGSASVVDYQNAIRSVEYSNSSENPSVLTRTVSFEINDGDLPSNTLSRDISIVSVNDAPVLSGIETTPANYTENDTPINITGNTAVSDVDDINIDGATIVITSNFATGEDVLNFTDQSGIIGIYDNNTGVLTLTGSATLAQYQTALQSVTYQNISNDPSDLTRSISFTINDGDDSSNVTTRDIDLTAVNDAPTLSAIETQPALFTENAAPLDITNNLTLTDVDDSNIESATVSITSNFVATEDSLVFADQFGITSVYDTATGVLTLTGSASVVDYQTAIRSVAYSNSSDNPSALTRTVSFEINDGDLPSNTLSRDISIAPVNDAPVLSGIETTPATFTENSASLTITGSTTVSDADDITIDGATIAITSNFARGEDMIDFANRFGITDVYDRNNGVLTLRGAATLAQYQTALQSIIFQNTSDDPSDLTRTISFTIHDGDANSNTVTRDIDLTPVNDAPILSAIETQPALFTENAAPLDITSNLTLTDVDDSDIESATVSITGNFTAAEDSLSVTLDSTTGISASFNSATGILTLTGTSSLANYEAALRNVQYQNVSDNPTTATRTVTFTVNDGDSDSVSASRNIELIPVNNAPTIPNIEFSNLQFLENSTPIATTQNIVIEDTDNATLQSAVVTISDNYIVGEDELVVDNALLNTQFGINATFDASTGTMLLTGSASPADYQQAISAIAYINHSETPSDVLRTLSYRVNDGLQDSNTRTRTIEIIPANDAPVADNLSITVVEDTDHIIPFADLSFTDEENHSLAEVIVDSTDPRLSVDNTAQTITYSPLPNFAGADSFDFQIRDDGGTTSGGNDTSAPSTISLTVTPVNDSPASRDVALPAVTEDTNPDGQFILSLIEPVFTELDNTDTLAGIAITANSVSQAEGEWQYSVSTGVWQNINEPSNTLSESNALLLDKDTAIRFLPATDYHGTPPPLSYKAIDSTFSGTFTTDTQRSVETTIIQNTAATADASSFSNTSVVTVQVNPENDAPVAANASLSAIQEDSTNPAGELIETLIASATDSDTARDENHTLLGIAITQNNESAANGSWQYQDNSGVWQDIGTVSSNNALLLDTSVSLRFLPQADYNGTPQSLSAHVVDSSYTGNLPAFVDAQLTGGNTLFSNQISISTNVIAVNDSPVQLGLEGNNEIEENTTSDNIGAVTFIDNDSNDTHQFSVSDDRFEIVNGILALRSGITLDHESEPEVPLQITVTDAAGATATQRVTLQVLNVNEPPVLSEQTEDQISTEPFSFTLPESVFTDADGDELSLTATLADGTPLPPWIQFDDGTFTVLDNALAESVNLIITATDPNGLSASSPITISIEPPLDAAVPAPRPFTPAPLPTTPARDTTPDNEVAASTSEQTDTTSDSESTDPPAEIFDASEISISEENEAEQQLIEVIQPELLNTAQSTVAVDRGARDVILANESNVLLTNNTSNEEQIRLQNAANIATLQNLASEADKNQAKLNNSLAISPTVVATSVTLSSGFSAGYILWLLRGGTLLASVMASMPAWRAIDPLPVLESLTNDDENDTETLQSMVEETETQETTDQPDKHAKNSDKVA